MGYEKNFYNIGDFYTRIQFFRQNIFLTTRPFFWVHQRTLHWSLKLGLKDLIQNNWVSLRTFTISKPLAPELKYCNKSKLFHKRLATDIEVGSISFLSKRSNPNQFRQYSRNPLPHHPCSAMDLPWAGSKQFPASFLILRESPTYAPIKPVSVEA